MICRAPFTDWFGSPYINLKGYEDYNAEVNFPEEYCIQHDAHE